MDLTIAMYGFLLYPTRSDGTLCRAVVAPTVTRGGLGHISHFWISGVVSASTVSAIPVGVVEGVVSLEHTRVDLSSSANPAVVSAFDLVPPFDQLKCGAVLDPGWESNRLGYVTSLIFFDGGDLIPFADNHTNSKKYEWDDCTGSRVPKELSSLLVYEKSGWDGVLRFSALRAGGMNGDVTFTGARAILGFLHDTPRNPVASDNEVDDAHAAATLQLCSVSGGSNLQYGIEHKVTSNRPGKNLPKDLKKFLRQKVGVVSAHKAGRPNCGARQMSEV